MTDVAPSAAPASASEILTGQPAPGASIEAHQEWMAQNRGVGPTLTPDEAKARIQTLTADKDFYNKLKQHDAASHREWAALHKAAYASDASPAGQEAARNAERMNSHVATLREVMPDMTPGMEAEIRAGVATKFSHDWAVRQVRLMIEDRAFRHDLLVEKKAEAREKWARINALAALRVVA
jgi:hypothetical protein